VSDLPVSAPKQPSPSRKRITTSAILAGICALSPVPFIDDLVIGAIRRHLVGRQFRARGVELSWGQRRALTKTHRSLLLGCVLGVVVYPVRKIFRKVFYIFAVKEAVDVASRLLHQGLLVEHALAVGCVDPAALGGDRAPLERLNRAIHDTCEDVGTSPINRILRNSFAGGRVFLGRLGRQAVRTLRALGVLRREEAVDAASEALRGEQERGMVGELSTALLGEGDYFDALALRFDDRWAESEPEVGEE
jgi:hypothetical protein